MEKQTKISFVLFISVFFLVAVHNIFFEIIEIWEMVFFILTLVALLCFILSVSYNMYTFLRKGKPKDLWKLGFLGFLGVIGFFESKVGLYGLFGFLGFFGLKRRKI